MTEAAEIEEAEALARWHRAETGVPIIVGPAFMRSCKEAGMDTSDLLEVADLSPGAITWLK